MKKKMSPASADKAPDESFFETILKAELDLHRAKNADYAGQGNDPLGNFKRVAHVLKPYKKMPLDHPLTVALVYTLKQLDSVMWAHATGRCSVLHEGTTERFMDVSNYANLAAWIAHEQA